ncbi:MAG: hypothetical protein KAU03_03495 [Candidatus Altiarchaeales archaeon]|nr:hypothetical protein [Candidatus Altiarchaeales archaeon]
MLNLCLYNGKLFKFVLPYIAEIKRIIQDQERELRSLVKASRDLRCDNLLVITWDYESDEEFKGKEIRFVPLWRWLLGSGEGFLYGRNK